MLAIRPPYEWPPIAAPGCSSTALRNTSMARSLLDFGRFRAVAPTPCLASSVTHGRIESAVPDAPWPRKRCGAVLTAALRLLTFENLERCRLGCVCGCRRTARQPGGADQRAAEQDATSTPERQSCIHAIQR